MKANSTVAVLGSPASARYLTCVPNVLPNKNKNKNKKKKLPSVDHSDSDHGSDSDSVLLQHPTVDVPVGNCMTRWQYNLETKQWNRLFMKPLLESVITFAKCFSFSSVVLDTENDENDEKYNGSVGDDDDDDELFIACSYDGEIVCCDRDWNSVMTHDKVVLPFGEKLGHASFALNGRSLIVTCGNCNSGSTMSSGGGGSSDHQTTGIVEEMSMIAVISIEKKASKKHDELLQERCQFELKVTQHRLMGEFEFAEFVNRDDQSIFTVCQNGTTGPVFMQRYGKRRRRPEEHDDGDNGEHGDNDGYYYECESEVVINDRGPSVSMVEPDEKHERAVIAFNDRSMMIVDMNTLNILCRFSCMGSSAIRCIAFEGDTIWTKSQARSLDEWKITAVAENDDDVNNNNEGEKHVSLKVELNKSYATAFSTVYMFCWHRIRGKLDHRDSDHGRYIWFMTDHALHLYDSTIEKDVEVSFHSLTCCGIDFSPDGQYLVSGDFCGNVFVWDLSSLSSPSMMNEQVYTVSQQTNVFMSVRALKCQWSRGDYYDSSSSSSTGDSDDHHQWLDVFIGTMDGNVFCWKVNLKNGAETSEPVRIFALQDSITCIELQHGPDPSLLAIGTSGGMLCVMERPRPGEGTLMRIKLAIVAHRPITDNTDLRFGSINKYSEVWSVSWSPCNNFIVTASEDQTCSIWNLYGEKMHSLTGHTTAVTAVEWRRIPSLGEVLITIADDRNVMVWRLNTPQNIHYHHHQQIASHRSQQNSADSSNPQYRDKKNKWGLYHVFSTEGYGLDWHTLTYMCVERSMNDRIAVATQNGYVFVWDIRTKQLISRYKRHNASIEGMAWSEDRTNNYLATCSSDCTINVYCMH